MNRRELIIGSARLTGIAAISPSVLFLTGCPQQNQAAALVGIAGVAIASLETIEGHTDAATKIQVDFAAAQTAVLNWKVGTPTQDVAQALQIVMNDINLLPVSKKDQAYILLAGGTVQSVLDLFPESATSPHMLANIQLYNPPKTKAEFIAQWNALSGNLAPLK